jgi:hypothetical protein
MKDSVQALESCVEGKGAVVVGILCFQISLFVLLEHSINVWKIVHERALSPPVTAPSLPLVLWLHFEQEL